MSIVIESDKKLSQIRVPPHSIEAEQSVLGGLMIDDQAWDKVVDLLSPEDFYRSDHGLIYKAMFSLVDKKTPIDVITISEMLTGINQLEKAGGMPYLLELAKNTPTASNVRAYAEIVRERSIFRKLVNAANDISASVFNNDGKDSISLLDHAEQAVFQIAERGARGSGPLSIQKVLAKAVNKIDQLFKNKNQITGIPTGFKELDKLTSGMQAGDLVIVAGRPSMGKTMLALNIVENTAIKEKKTVLFFSLEMPADSLALRMLSSLGRIDQHALRTGQLTGDDWNRFSSAVSLLTDTKLHIDETPGITSMELRTRARRMVREHGELGLIVVDYLQLMQGTNKNENRTSEISEISRSLKLIAKELGVPVIALSQLNRELEHRPNKRPIMSDLRDSGAIEQDADLIAFIYRDEVYNKETEYPGRAEIIVSKQRNGPIGTVNLAFVGKYCSFENLTLDYSTE